MTDKAKKKIFELQTEYFERFFFRLETPQLYYVKVDENGGFVLYKPREFSQFCQNSNIGNFFKKWKTLSVMRSYSKLQFCPPPLRCSTRCYNSFNGMAIDAFKTNVINEVSNLIYIVLGAS